MSNTKVKFTDICKHFARICKICIVTLFLLAFPAGKANSEVTNTLSDEEKIEFYSQKFKIILQTLHKYYDDSLHIDELCDKTMNAMLTTLDPFSRYFNAKTWKELNAEVDGDKIGIGLELYKLNDTITVVNVSKGSGAENAGILSGDKIIAIDDSNFIGKPVSEADAFLERKENEIVKLKILRVFDNRIVEQMVAIKDYPISSIHTSFLVPDTDILYIKLARFSKLSYDELLAEMAKYSGKFSSLILDLKDNAGGQLTQVLDICREFTSAKDTILSIKSKSQLYDSVYVNTNNGRYHKLPLVAVINEKTASASEIFSGLLQDLDRGLVVGKTSVGKGLVQRSWTYSDSSAFRITVAKYYTPSGRLVNKSATNEEISFPELELKDPEIASKLQEQYKDINKNIKITSSRKGRPLISLGGILPDKLIDEEPQNKLSKILKNNGYILAYSLYWYTLNYDKFCKYKNSEDYRENYKVDDDFLSAFLGYLQEKNMFDKDMFIERKATILNQLKAYIAYYMWGNEGHYRVLFDNDKQIQAAIDCIKEAKDMIK